MQGISQHILLEKIVSHDVNIHYRRKLSVTMSLYVCLEMVALCISGMVLEPSVSYINFLITFKIF